MAGCNGSKWQEATTPSDMRYTSRHVSNLVFCGFYLGSICEHTADTDTMLLAGSLSIDQPIVNILDEMLDSIIYCRTFLFVDATLSRALRFPFVC